MGRPVTLFTGQWADLKLETVAQKASEWGYDGLELACWGDHFNVDKATGPLHESYCTGVRALLAKRGLNVWSVSNHLAGQLVLDPNDVRSDGFAPDWCAGAPEQKRQWAIDQMKKTAHAARNLRVKDVNGFVGSSIWHYIYSFPPVSPEQIEEGFDLFIAHWGPIMEVFAECKVRFALEVHPTEIAFDIVTAARLLAKINQAVKQKKWSKAAGKAFGFNFDPSHLYWQGVDPVKFLFEFKDRIYHVHVKDAVVTLDGRSGILSSHLNFGDPRRGWDFRSPGRGAINFEEIIRALNTIGYKGPLSVEWEDCGMDREHGAREACTFVRELDFEPSARAFDAAFAEK